MITINSNNIKGISKWIGKRILHVDIINYIIELLQLLIVKKGGDWYFNQKTS